MNNKKITVVIMLIFSGVCFAGDVETVDEVRFDFETGDMQGWVVVQQGFGQLVCDREEVPYMARSNKNKNKRINKQGKYFLSSFDTLDNRPNDGLTGVAESPVFELTGPEMSFLIASHPALSTYLALCTLDGHEVLKARGAPLSDTMERVHWHVPKLVGKKVFLRFVDRGYAAYQHIYFDDFKAHGKFAAEATAKRFGIDLLRKRAQDRFEQINLRSLKKAIDDLAKTFGRDYPDSDEFLIRLNGYQEQLESIKKQITSGNEQDLRKIDEMIGKILEFQFSALVANPLVSSQPILFTVRQQYYWGHHNTETLFQNGQINEKRPGFGGEIPKFEGGGALKSINFSQGGTVTTLITLPEGIARDPEVHFDGTKIIFSMRKNTADDYHIYQINAEGSDLRQLTFASGISDIDPLYLADDKIAFSSTRDPKFCGCNRHIMANIYRMDSDGANIHRITKNSLFDGQGTLMPDGRILYNRWEYVDRNFGDAQGLWTVNPDGTNQAVYWGNNTSSPGSVLDARVIPQTQKTICTFSSCHSRPWGAIAVIDRRIATDGGSAVEHIWPKSARGLLSVESGLEVPPSKKTSFKKGQYIYFDSIMSHVKLKYEDPFPLNDKYFLCSRMTGLNDQTGIYLIDVFGNEILLHTEASGCYDPMPIRPSERPIDISQRRDFEDSKGSLYVLNVYEGTHMKNVKPGSVKYLRVVEAPEKRFYANGGWGGQGAQVPAMNWHNFENKRILGTVAVEEDGSAYFEVPSDKFIFFQLLDEKKMMIQTMRSGTVVQAKEMTGCVGCHEDRRTAPKNTKQTMPTALRRKPDKLNGWFGPPREFNYLEQVQPVFDKNCVSCHDYGKESAKKLNLAGDLEFVFNNSYIELWRKGYINAIGAGPPEIQQPYAWGSHASKLVETIVSGHYDVKLSDEEFEKIVTWVDLNGPYYPYFSSAYPRTFGGRSPLTNKQMSKLIALTNMDPALRHIDHPGAAVSFTRPRLSPCLDKFSDVNDPGYIEALAIIQSGKDRLQKKPRADMPGYSMSPWHEQVQQNYDNRREIELDNRRAISTGQKRYEEKLQECTVKGAKE